MVLDRGEVLLGKGPRLKKKLWPPSAWGPPRGQPHVKSKLQNVKPKAPVAVVQKARKVQKKVVKGVHGTRVKKVILIRRRNKDWSLHLLLNRLEPA